MQRRCTRDENIPSHVNEQAPQYPQPHAAFWTAGCCQLFQRLAVSDRAWTCWRCCFNLSSLVQVLLAIGLTVHRLILCSRTKWATISPRCVRVWSQKAHVHPKSVCTAGSPSIQVQYVCGSCWESSCRFHSHFRENEDGHAVHRYMAGPFSALGRGLFSAFACPESVWVAVGMFNSKWDVAYGRETSSSGIELMSKEEECLWRLDAFEDRLEKEDCSVFGARLWSSLLSKQTSGNEATVEAVSQVLDEAKDTPEDLSESLI